MRIAYFSDSYLPNVSGVSHSVETFSRLLSKDQQVRVYVPAYGWRETKEKEGNREICRYKSISWPAYKGFHLCLPNVGRILKDIEEFKPDVIHIHTPITLGLMGIIAAKKLGVPLVGTYHTLCSEILDYISVRRLVARYAETLFSFDGEKTEKTEGFSKKLTWQVINKFYSFCDLVICPSDSIKNELLVREFKKPLMVLSNGIDIGIFSCKPEEKRIPIVMYVGRLGFEKKVDEVVKAFSLVVDRMPEVRLWIVGDGPARRGLEDLVRELGISKQVRWLGMIKRNKLPKIYAQGSVLVTASAMETQGLTTLEGMACGLPVVGVRAYALPDLIKDGRNGYLVEPGEIYGMSQKIIGILKDRKLREKMGENSISMAKKHDILKIIKEVVDIYQKLIYR